MAAQKLLPGGPANRHKTGQAGEGRSRLTGMVADRGGRRPGYREHQVLALVIELGRAPSHGEIARRLGMLAPHSCRVINQLERRGWVARLGDARNRRTVPTLEGILAAGIAGLAPLLLPYVKASADGDPRTIDASR